MGFQCQFQFIVRLTKFARFADFAIFANLRIKPCFRISNATNCCRFFRILTGFGCINLIKFWLIRLVKILFLYIAIVGYKFFFLLYILVVGVVRFYFRFLAIIGQQRDKRPAAGEQRTSAGGTETDI